MCSRLKQRVFGKTILLGNHLSNGWRWSSSDQRHERHFNSRRPDSSTEKARQEEPQLTIRGGVGIWCYCFLSVVISLSLCQSFSQRGKGALRRFIYQPGIILLRIFHKTYNLYTLYPFLLCACNAGDLPWEIFEPQPEERSKVSLHFK